MITRRILLSALIFTGLTFATSPLLAKDFGKEAETFIQTLADEAMNSFRTTKDEDIRDKEFRRLLNDGFDVRAIG